MLARSHCPSSLHTDLLDSGSLLPSLSLLALVRAFHQLSQSVLRYLPVSVTESVHHLPDRMLPLSHSLSRRLVQRAALCIDPAVTSPRSLIPDYWTTLIQLQ